MTKEIQTYWKNINNEVILSNNFILTKKYEKSNKLIIFDQSYKESKNIKIEKFVCSKFHIPLVDEAVNRIIIFNYLKKRQNLNNYFKELWRILTPNGKILIITPNRNSLWSIRKNKKFKNLSFLGFYEILEVLNENLFTSLRLSSRVFFEPRFYELYPNILNFIDVIGSKWFIPFGGFIFIEAEKNLFNPIFCDSNFNNKAMAN